MVIILIEVGSPYVNLIMHACLVIQSCPALCDSMDCSPPSSILVMDFQQGYWVGYVSQEFNSIFSCISRIDISQFHVSLFGHIFDKHFKI